MGIARASSNLVRVDPSASAQYAPCWIRPALIFFFFRRAPREQHLLSTCRRDAHTARQTWRRRSALLEEGRTRAAPRVIWSSLIRRQKGFGEEAREDVCQFLQCVGTDYPNQTVN